MSGTGNNASEHQSAAHTHTAVCGGSGRPAEALAGRLRLAAGRLCYIGAADVEKPITDKVKKGEYRPKISVTDKSVGLYFRHPAFDTDHNY